MTPTETYQRRQRECRTLLERIAAGLDVHATRQRGRPEDWGWCGDLGEIKSRLADVLDFMGGRNR